MQDEPTPAEILDAVARFLKDVVQPQLSGREAFDNRVASNALDLIRRQIDPDSAPAATAEHDRLVALLGHDGSLAELNRALCQRIAAGDFDLSNTRLIEHLRMTTLAKCAVDQPNYASYVRALAEWQST